MPTRTAIAIVQLAMLSGAACGQQVDVSTGGGENRSAGSSDLKSCIDEPPDGVRYAVEHERCPVVDYACEEDEVHYGDDCGCGCVKRSSCLEYPPPHVRYVADKQTCNVLLYACRENEQYYSDECGCGCLDTSS